jgi:hypothetical protein
MSPHGVHDPSGALVAVPLGVSASHSIRTYAHMVIMSSLRLLTWNIVTLACTMFLFPYSYTVCCNYMMVGVQAPRYGVQCCASAQQHTRTLRYEYIARRA